MSPACSVLSLCTPRFQAGRLGMTPGVRDLIAEGKIDLIQCLRRHLSGDWGDIVPEDRQANDRALRDGGRLFSAYAIAPDLNLWIITEADRRTTTALLPDEY